MTKRLYSFYKNDCKTLIGHGEYEEAIQQAKKNTKDGEKVLQTWQTYEKGFAVTTQIINGRKRFAKDKTKEVWRGLSDIHSKWITL